MGKKKQDRKGGPPVLSMTVTARQFAYVTNNNPSDQCELDYGTDQMYVYSIYTHPDQNIVEPSDGLSNTPVTESFSPGVACGAVTGSGTIFNGQFTDHVSSGCSSSPLTCTQTVTQKLSVAGYLVRTNKLQFTNMGVTYTNQGPTQ